jgi:UDP-MurNAc hydroxylase
MRFTILSHAGLEISGAGKSLVVDPWVVGSTYWRSWWNYPPVAPELVARLRPDLVYLTHIHWDHFQGASLKRFARSTPIVVPKGHFARMRRDLAAMGFDDVRELRHGESLRLADGFTITSYQFYPFLDSALVVECEGTTLLDANDAKFMGPPLEQILARHPRIDFVFRSHSSANGRICFDVVDDPARPLDDDAQYLASFASFVRRCGARYAVPFASNHCFLHRDTFDLNHTVKTPMQVEEYFRAHRIERPELRVMLTGDSWDAEAGFAIDRATRGWLEDRERGLREYRERNRAKLEAFYAEEARTRVPMRLVERYFREFRAALPWPARRAFKDLPIHFVLAAGERRTVVRVDLWRGAVAELPEAEYAPGAEPFEVHTSAFVFKRCVALKLFGHLAISKRVRFRSTRRLFPRMKLLELLLALFEVEILPLRNALRWRVLETTALRWRELLLYARIAKDLALGRPFSQERYIGAAPFDAGAPASPLAPAPREAQRAAPPERSGPQAVHGG